MGSQSISYACEGSICNFVTVCRRSFQFLKLQHLKRTQESYCLFRAILSIKMSNDFLFWSKCYSSAALTSGSDLEKVWEGNLDSHQFPRPFWLSVCVSLSDDHYDISLSGHTTRTSQTHHHCRDRYSSLLVRLCLCPSFCFQSVRVALCFCSARSCLVHT